MFSDISNFLEMWVRRVNEKRIEEVLALYGEEAILLPTFSSQVMKGLAQIRSYFEMLGAKDGVRVKVREDSVETQALGDGIFNLMGIYDWYFTNPSCPRSHRHAACR